MKSENILSEIVEELWNTEPLLYDIFCTHNLEENPFLNVMFRTGQKKIQFNPEILKNTSEEKVKHELVKELYRILLKHPYERVPENPNHVALTKSSDITIDENCLFEKNQDLVTYNLPEKKSYEEYYGKLKYLVKDPPKIMMEMPVPSQNPDGGRPQEDQSDLEEASGKSASNIGQTKREFRNLQAAETSELWSNDEDAADEIDQQIAKAEQTDKWGSVSGEIIQKLLANKNINLPYVKILNHFKTSICSDYRQLTRFKPSRRFGFDYMGSRYKNKAKLMVGVDISGSISNDDIQNFFSIVNRFFKYGVKEIRVVTFDTEIKQDFSLKKARKQIEVKGRGGTDFQPVINLFEKSNYDGMIIFTDGFAYEPKIRKSDKILWILNNQYAYRNQSWLKKIRKSQITYIKQGKSYEENYFC